MRYKTMFFLLAATLSSYAGWPVFSVPQLEQILPLIHQNDCEYGYGKIFRSEKIKIESRYIPKNETWYWIYTGDENCHPWTKLVYNNYIPLNQAVYSGGTISTYFGEIYQRTFQFDFVVPQGDCPDSSCPWDCGPLYNDGKLPEKIGCAQDQK